MRIKEVDKFGHLTVIERNGKSNDGHYMWLCKCDCGNEVTVRGNNLTSGHTTTCDCRLWSDVPRYFKANIPKPNKEKSLKKKIVPKKIKVQNKETGHIKKKTLQSTPQKMTLARNKFEISNGVVKIYVNNSDDVILCDIEDWEKLKYYRWYKNMYGYAESNDENHKKIKMHKVIIGNVGNMIIDHINRNKLDNRKCNLRVVTKKANGLNRDLRKENTSGYAGVSEVDTGWKATITENGKNINIGIFSTKKRAIKARREAEKRIYGIYSNNNYIE